MKPEDLEDWMGLQAGELRKKLDSFLGLGRIAQALRLLDRAAQDRQLDLFSPDSAVEARRQLAWLYKINLLRTLRRTREALAWACMECELNPQNATAQAMKEELKGFFLPPGKAPADGTPARSRPDALWEGVAGMRELKAILERDVILPLLQPAIYRRYRLSLPNGVLLYGPPGCGKTFIAEKLGKLLGFHVINVKPSDLGSIYVHGGQKMIGALFAQARKQAPCLIFLDELDALIPTRSGEVGHHYASEVNEFLTQLNNAADQRILVVGATNRLDRLDAAATRPGRFDKKVFVGPPDLEARVELLRLYLKDRPQDAIDIMWVAREGEGYTCADLSHVVNEAARRALEDRRPIFTNDLLAALAANPPTGREEGKARQ